ncbi:aminotransferase [Mesorhizobium sp. BH1-1-4]|uniref:aminotransferase n=1 Tax=Mesorhizobium sp. BH1-1-4 TaxID=2876662 RepID=UPI001CD0E38C|nr:aminotransferase [Mesorhizobium sp. BH1-1-4]MBZ9994311.1 aminotransferase class III-fold pyridoxal phosphate-dependent enzyme [Mesorhizobium sp. BH1-1-4]
MTGVSRDRTPGLDVAFHLHSQTNPQQLKAQGPAVIERGEGVRIFDSSGKEFIDGMSGLWCASLGFGNKRLAEVIYEHSKRIGYYHTFFSRTSHEVSLLAEELATRSLIENAHVYFATSGSEANETMVKLAWVYHTVRGNPGKRKVISRRKSFHGSTIAAASMCGLQTMHREFALPIPGFLHVSFPDMYRGMDDGETAEQYSDRLAAELELMIVREGADTVAAFIAEPIMAGAGVVAPPQDYFRKIKAVLDKYDVLLLDDEIVTGFARTGNWFGRQTTNMQPHMMALAKGLTSSYFPMSAVVMAPEIYEAVAEFNKSGSFFGHGFTNSGHPVGAAVALECLKIYEEMDVVPHVRAMGERLKSHLREIAAGSSIVGDIRGVGLMFGIELVNDKDTKAPFAPAFGAGFKCDTFSVENGLVARATGDCLVLAPPLVVTEADVDEIAERFGKALKQFQASIGR